MLDLLFGLPWWGALVATAAVFFLAVDVGYRLAGRAAAAASQERMAAQVSVLVGALLALLGLLLAFSFTIVESRFAARKALVLDEANAIGTSYLRAKILPEPHAERTRSYLRQYVDLRISPKTPSELEVAIQRSEQLHAELWIEAEAVGRAEPQSEVVGLFISSLNEVIDLHTSRVTVALHQRLPRPIFNVLLLVSLLALVLLGYGAGLSQRRSPLPTLAVILAISSVIVLINGLDTPGDGLFQVNQWAMEDLRRTIGEP